MIAPSLIFASTVTIVPTPAGARLLSVLDQYCRSQSCSLVITSGADSHPADDPHTRGEAFDVSVRGLTPQAISVCVRWLRSILGTGFTVLYETPTPTADPILIALFPAVNPQATGPHLHLQLRKGTGPWPQTRTV